MQTKKKNPSFTAILLIVSLAANIFLIYRQFAPLASKTTSSSVETVTKVIDGDTFDTKGGKRIRLALIDAPEYSTACLSQESKNRLGELVLNKEITVTELTKENFGRIVALVDIDGLSVNKALLTEGMAAYRAETKLKDYDKGFEDAQNEAIAAKRGIWSDKCANTKSKGCIIKGNFRADTGTRIYHLPGCYNYDKITVNLRGKDRWFCSEEEAQKEGFVKSLDCP